MEDIKNLAKQYADKSVLEDPDTNWHSHYYGFIFGFQSAKESINTGKWKPLKKDLKNMRCEAMICHTDFNGKCFECNKQIFEKESTTTGIT